MFCEKCGHKTNPNDNYCLNCGSPIKKHNAKILNFKLFLKKYKKYVCLGVIGLLILLVAIAFYGKIVGFESLRWNETYENYNLDYISQGKVVLGVNISNTEKTSKVEYVTTCGDFETNGSEVIWDLTYSLGDCEITAKYKLKKISKNYTVISSSLSELNPELSLEYNIDYDSNEDLDLDGLSNKEEKELGTNPKLIDSDMDGLDDYYEISNSKTSPVNKDTDGDGINDYDEIELGLDPLKKDSKDDGINDSDRTLTYIYNDNGIKLEIEGKGNIASLIADISSNNKISNKKGLIDKLYTFHTDGTINKALVTIPYTLEEIEKYSLNENNLSLYYYNIDDSTYEKVETSIDKDNKTLTATLKHLSNYVVGDSNLMKEKFTAQILFVLDNSWSMYSDEQYRKITGEDYSSSLFGFQSLDGFDKEGLRFSLTSDLVTKLASKNYEIGLSEFRNDYKEILPIGSDINSLKEKLNYMNGHFVTDIAGTNIEIALNSSINEFSKESDNKYIVILTDGQDTSLNSNVSSIIKKAVKKDVKICSIGFGDSSYNEALINIANGTGCKFFSSSNSNGLYELFDNIATELGDDLVDIDNDNNPDGILLADSGFIVNRDGFSFANYTSNLAEGHCFGMATFAQLYYKKILPLKVDSKTCGEDKSYAYDLSNTYFKDYANLYDYKLKSNIFKYIFGFANFDEDIPIDFRYLKDDVLYINERYKKLIVESNVYDIKELESTASKEEKIKNWGVNYKRIEYLLLNEDKIQNNNNINNVDLQLLNAIYTAFIKQNETKYYSSSSSFIFWLADVLGIDSIEYKNGNAFLNILKARLEDSDAPVIAGNFNNGGHAINAISLIQDIDNPNYYYIGVYDNNYPGEKRYVDVECNKKYCVTKANQYYKKSKEPIRITISSEYDLKYYE